MLPWLSLFIVWLGMGNSWGILATNGSSIILLYHNQISLLTTFIAIFFIIRKRRVTLILKICQFHCLALITASPPHDNRQHFSLLPKFDGMIHCVNPCWGKRPSRGEYFGNGGRRHPDDMDGWCTYVKHQVCLDTLAWSGQPISFDTYLMFIVAAIWISLV